MAEIRINATGGVKLYDADDSHYAQIIAGTITSNVDALTLGHASADFNIPVKVLGTTPTLTIGDAGAEDTKIVFDGNAQDFYIALDDSADDLLIGLGSTVGTTPIIAIDENKLSTFSGAVTVGVDDTGHDVKLFGATAGSFLLWDESADSLLLTDSTPIKIGDAQDLTLYHDGSNSYITNAVGALKIATETSGIALTIGHTTSEVTIGDNLTTTGTLTVGSTGITANGITMLDQWVCNDNQNISADSETLITGNWVDYGTTDSGGNIGSSMTQSSGIFTFPSTGVYAIDFVIQIAGAGGANDQVQAYFLVTTDNSSYTDVNDPGGFFADAGDRFTGIGHFALDVTNTTNVKVKFTALSVGQDAQVQGDANRVRTGVTFTRIGDT